MASQPPRRTLLFFDDLHLNRLDHVVREIGRPIIEGVYRDPVANTAWGFPSVWRDPDSGVWRMGYQGWLPDGRKAGLVAESHDGFTWAPRDTTDLLDFADRRAAHQVLAMPGNGEWASTYEDPFAAPDQRFKALTVHHLDRFHGTTLLWVSREGLDWRRVDGVEWTRPGPDPGAFVYFNEVTGKYTLTVRPDWTDRRIALVETEDWRRFTTPELILGADALDRPLTQPYGLPVIPYEGLYVGLLWLYGCSPVVAGHSPHKFYDGRVDCQLAYSLNGRHFQRTLRTPFVANGEPGSPDAGCVYPSAVAPQPDGSLRIYASACTHEHGHIPAGSGSIVIYRLRRDGWVYLASRDGDGVVGTRPVWWHGGPLELNVQALGGWVTTQLTDPQGEALPGYDFAACEPCSSDELAWQPVWRGGRTAAALAGRAIRIEVTLRHARLYAIRGALQSLTAAECWRAESAGEPPVPRPGF